MRYFKYKRMKLLIINKIFHKALSVKLKNCPIIKVFKLLLDSEKASVAINILEKLLNR